MISWERRLCRLALTIIILAFLTNCRLIWGVPVREIGGSGDLDLILWVSRSLPSPGQTVHIKYTVENAGNRTEVIELEDKPVMDISIHFGHGSHWTTLYWSDGREITPEMSRLRLAPGESKTIEMTWIADKKAEGGPVSVHGILNWAQMYSSYVPVMICVGSCGIK